MVDLAEIRTRARVMADHHHHRLVAAVARGLHAAHRSGIEGCPCGYCQHLKTYVRWKILWERAVRSGGAYRELNEEYRRAKHKKEVLSA